MTYLPSVGSTLACLKGTPAWWAQPAQKQVQLHASCGQQLCPAQPREQHPQPPLTWEEGHAPPLPAPQPVPLPPRLPPDRREVAAPGVRSRSKPNQTPSWSGSGGKGRHTNLLPRSQPCAQQHPGATSCPRAAGHHGLAHAGRPGCLYPERPCAGTSLCSLPPKSVFFSMDVTSKPQLHPTDPPQAQCRPGDRQLPKDNHRTLRHPRGSLTLLRPGLGFTEG